MGYNLIPTRRQNDRITRLQNFTGEYWNSFISGAMRRKVAKACAENEGGGVGKNGQKERSHKTKRDKVNCQNRQSQVTAF